MFKEILIKNNVFRSDLTEKFDVERNPQYIAKQGSLLERLHNCKKEINEKAFGNISSFNFNREVFNSGNWNDLNIKARGLFINNETGKIVARGFEKFFAYKERSFNSDEWLSANLKFPVQCYEKHNGFLGILGFDEDRLLFCSKSTVGGDYAKIFEQLFKATDHNEKELLEYMQRENSCLVFEVIDHVNDPHIVEYDWDGIVLLDIIKLEEDFKTVSYDELKNFAVKFNFNAKIKLDVELNNWQELKQFIDENEADNTRQHEGYVFVDAANYYFKYKCKWYKFWKKMRGLLNKVCARHTFSISGLQDPNEIKFLTWMKNKEIEWLKEKNIIELRKIYEQEILK